MNKGIILLAVFFGLITWTGYSNSQLGGMSTAPVGKVFTYKSTTTVTSPTVLNLTGLGSTWIFSVAGGSASTFKSS